MEFDFYQSQASATAVFPPELQVIYPALGLGNEAGEVQGKIKKVLRDNNGEFTPEKVKEIAAELGDVLWYLAALAGSLGLSLSEIADQNLEKLFDRKARGVIGGSGDKR